MKDWMITYLIAAAWFVGCYLLVAFITWDIMWVTTAPGFIRLIFAGVTVGIPLFLAMAA
jgi:hypothetical protein